MPRRVGRREIESHFREVSDLLARQAERRGGAPWMRTFDEGDSALPRSYGSERLVRDSACVWLVAVAAERGYHDPRWCTAATVRRFGGYVYRG